METNTKMNMATGLSSARNSPPAALHKSFVTPSLTVNMAPMAASLSGRLRLKIGCRTVLYIFKKLQIVK